MIAQLDFDLPLSDGERAINETRRRTVVQRAVSNLSMLVDYDIDEARAAAADLLEDVNDHEGAKLIRERLGVS